MSGPIGTYELVALDCDDHVAVAEFYRRIVGGEIKSYDGVADWIELHTTRGTIAFQHVAGHRPPTWPEGERPQQAHLDIDVHELDAAQAAVVELGAVVADVQPSPDKWRVCFDPAGHPFCLVRVPESSG